MAPAKPGHGCRLGSCYWVCSCIFLRDLDPLIETCSGAGYIGSFTALTLLEAGYKVVIVDNLYNSSAEVINRIELICGKRPEFVNLNVTDEEAFDKVFEAHPDIDSVIHFAALKVRLFVTFTTSEWAAYLVLFSGCRGVWRDTA